MNLSASFILPILKLDCIIYKHGLINTYLGDADYAKGWGDYLFIEMDNSSTKLDCLTKNPLYVDSYPRGQTTTMYVFNIQGHKNIIEPFKEGKYSKIDRAYVVRNFPHIEGANKSINREILDKSPRIRQYQEERIGVTLPPNAEVWDRPIPEKEVYAYVGQELELA